MTRCQIEPKIIFKVTQFLMLLLTLAACGDIIKIVPAETPTPVAAATEQAAISAAEESDLGLPNRIVAEAINLDAPVIEMGWRMVQQGNQTVSEWEMPDNEAGWHRNSARPGQGSNVIISGHNASTGGHVFAELDELQVGDEITVENDRAEGILYRVIEKTIVRSLVASEEAQQYLLDVSQPTSQEQLTLITCWPRWSNTHRLVVIARPIPNVSPPP